jgi:hypothetical protein
MRNLILQATLLVGAILLSTKAFPGTETEVFKCRDSGGHLLLTDKPCGIGQAAVAIHGGVSEPAAQQGDDLAEAGAGARVAAGATAAAATPDTGWTSAEADPAPLAVIIRAPSPGSLLQAKPLRRPLAIDIDTLKQAKLAMLNDDAVWASQRALRD